MATRLNWALVLIALILVSCGKTKETKTDQAMTDDQIIAIATKAYTFGYPLVLMDYSRRVGTNVEAPTAAASAPMNQVGHFRRFPDDTFTGVVKPNVDTYYSIAWFDLKKEPMVLSVPATERYYLLPLLDAYTNVFTVLGPRTTGKTAQHFLLAGPDWMGDMPKEMTLIKSPTNMAWMLGRTQVNSPQDGATVVKKVQDGYTLVPLSSFGQAYTPPKGVVSEVNKEIVPVEDVRKLSIENFFTLFAQLMANNPPAAADSAMLKEMASIGIVPGQPFSSQAFSQQVKDKLSLIPAERHSAWQSVADKSNPETLKNGWLILNQGMGSYGTNYDLRALIAYLGLGANLPEDAIYPSTSVDSDGNPLTGTENYVLHFGKYEIPPVNAFWSLTAYDKRNLLVANPINRFSVGDRNKLKYNMDGSLDIYIRNTSPGKDKEANWLPSPKEGPLYLTLRLYWPKEEALTGIWTPPAVRKYN